jgi:hypothetical protein
MPGDSIQINGTDKMIAAFLGDCVQIMEKTYSKFMEQTDSRLLKDIKETEDKAAAKDAEDERMALKELASIDRCGNAPRPL